MVETIREKVFHLPQKAQEEVLEIVEQIEKSYHIGKDSPLDGGSNASPHPLRMIADLAVDVGVSDLAERHDFYSNGGVED